MDATTPAPSAPPQAARRLSLRGRLTSAAVSAGALGVLAFAGLLEPAEAGHGTHEQLGLPPCAWPAVFGYPCPTCGMTTAFAAAADGQLAASFHAQPFGLLLAVAIAAAFWVGLHGAATGSRAGLVFGGMLKPRWLWRVAGAAATGWAYKIATWHP